MILRLPDTLFGGIAATWRNDSRTPIQGEVAKVCNIEVLQKRYFRRGDSNADGKVNIADGVSTLGLRQNQRLSPRKPSRDQRTNKSCGLSPHPPTPAQHASPDSSCTLDAGSVCPLSSLCLGGLKKLSL